MFKKLVIRFPALWFVLVPPTSVKNKGRTDARTAGNNFVAIPSAAAATGGGERRRRRRRRRRSRKMTNFDRLPATIFRDNSEIGGLDGRGISGASKHLSGGAQYPYK